MLPLCEGAVIQGEIYDASLHQLSNAVVTINTQPQQQKVAKNNSYSFSVAPGMYIIEAKHYEGREIKDLTEQEINVTQEGTFVVDLILWPSLAEDEQLYNETEEDYTVEFDEGSPKNSLLPLWLIGVVIVTCGAYLLYKKYGSRMNSVNSTERYPKPKAPVSEQLVDNVDEDTDYTKIAALIKKNRRLTQKDIRKEVPVSEAKVSLMLTEMEEKGLIKKVKKGRSNIILLKE